VTLKTASNPNSGYLSGINLSNKKIVFTKNAFNVVWLLQAFLAKVVSAFKAAQLRVSTSETVKQVQLLHTWTANLIVIAAVLGVVFLPTQTRTEVVPA
jgi:hypothetical protein